MTNYWCILRALIKKLFDEKCREITHSWDGLLDVLSSQLNKIMMWG